MYVCRFYTLHGFMPAINFYAMLLCIPWGDVELQRDFIKTIDIAYTIAKAVVLCAIR